MPSETPAAFWSRLKPVHQQDQDRPPAVRAGANAPAAASAPPSAPPSARGRAPPAPPSTPPSNPRPAPCRAPRPALGPSPMARLNEPEKQRAYILYPRPPSGYRYHTSSSSTASSTRSSGNSTRRVSPTSTAPTSGYYTPLPMTPERAQKLAALAGDVVGRAGKGVSAIVAGIGDKRELETYMIREEATAHAAVGFHLAVIREIGTLFLKLAGYSAAPDPTMGDYSFLFDLPAPQKDDYRGRRTYTHNNMAYLACSISQGEFINFARTDTAMLRDLTTFLGVGAPSQSNAKCLLHALTLREELNSAVHDTTVAEVRAAIEWMANTPTAKLVGLLGWTTMRDYETAIDMFTTAAHLLIMPATDDSVEVESLLWTVRETTYPGKRMYFNGWRWAKAKQKEKLDSFLGTLRKASVVFKDDLGKERKEIKSDVDANLEATSTKLKSDLNGRLEANSTKLKSDVDAKLAATNAKLKSDVEANLEATNTKLEATNAKLAENQSEMVTLKAQLQLILQQCPELKAILQDK